MSEQRENSLDSMYSVEDTGNMRHSRLFSFPDVGESLDFDVSESVVWRKHHLRRFFQERTVWWTQARRTTAYKWILVVYCGVIVGIAGFFVLLVTAVLFDLKFSIANHYTSRSEMVMAFIVYTGFSVVYAMVASSLCWIEPAAAGAGITEVKAFLNGVNLKKYVRIQVFYCKLVGMCFSVGSSLPLGKEGPMIHCGAIMGAAVSQGRTNFFGFDTSWTKYQDLRNDLSKRDFVTFGAASGIAAAFLSPIGGILFCLEEGASFWSNAVTFRGFFCALVTVLIMSLLSIGNVNSNEYGSYAFGTFVNYRGDQPNYYIYELANFALLGCAGGAMGAVFNHINRKVNMWRRRSLTTTARKMQEVFLMVVIWCIICFGLSVLWNSCTPLPTNTADWTPSEQNLLDALVKFDCQANYYNQVASLLFAPPEIVMYQLFHFKEYDHTNYTSFSTGALLIFFPTYFLMAAYTAGAFIPAGLFVPCLIAGAGFGRLIGHLLNVLFAGFVADSGTYALIGAAAVMGGMSRMTIAGTVIILEACGNSSYLLPLMITFAAARYTGNAINDGMYDMQMKMRKYPFLEGNLKSLGILNYHPVSEIMSNPVVQFRNFEEVKTIYNALKAHTHNGFPIVGSDGHLKGFILRKTLCSLLKYRVFSKMTNTGGVEGSRQSEGLTRQVSMPVVGTSKQYYTLSNPDVVFWDTMEREYPKFPEIDDVSLSHNDFNRWLDLRLYMDTSPYTIHESASIQRTYRYFRTMGLRHLIVLDCDHKVVGMITRHDLVEHRLEHHVFDTEGKKFQKYADVDRNIPVTVHEDDESIIVAGRPSDLESGLGSRPGTFTGGGPVMRKSATTVHHAGTGRNVKTSYVGPASTQTSINEVAVEDDKSSVSISSLNLEGDESNY